MGGVASLGGRYDPKVLEEHILRFWDDNRVYDIVKKTVSVRRNVFYFIDGPPYASSGIPHVGTGWNKVLKDAVLRYRRLRGYNVLDRPGYDCHGLPIEVTIEKSLGIRYKRDIEGKVGVERFIKLCRDFALKNAELMTKWFKDLGVFMDWDNPYLTLSNDYIEAAWWLVKKADEKGLLVSERRVVYWCPRCSTTLAEYEVNYEMLEDPSIYVKFRVRGKDDEYLLIWTTTPWTLPANTFVMAHPDAKYVKVRVGREKLILAKSRINVVFKEAGVEKYEVIEEFEGRLLEGLEYEHPLKDLVPIQEVLEKYHKVVMAPEFVSLEEGTGLVHGAPGHGFEDFEVAERLGITEIISPVNDEGVFTEDVGKYSGKPVREANSEIIEDLRRRGALLHEGRVRHRYPACWRCRSPVVLRAKEQWVLKVTKLKELIVKEARSAKWIPDWAYLRIQHMIENLKDWVLSRQRYWGTPLPIWICPRGHKVVIGGVDELRSLGGSVPDDLHRPWIDGVKLKCPICGCEMRRVPDVMDVWFDSGIAFFASQGVGKEGFNAADFIVEGHDQTRGWFFSMLRAGVVGFGRVPYKTVLVHGFVLDEKGREMHKSLGNYVGINDVLSKEGRDIFRLAVLRNTVWEDLKFSWKMFEECRRDLSIVWNVFVFASTYMNLDRFDPIRYTLDKLRAHLRFEDRWLLSKSNRLVKSVTAAFEDYRIHDAVRELIDFIVEDVSHWYVRLIRPRVWIEENTPDKLAAYATLYDVLRKWLIMASPIVPFITEAIYQRMIRPAEPEAPVTIQLLEWPRADESMISKEIEGEMKLIKEIFEATAAARMKAKIKLRQPLRRIIIYTENKTIERLIRERGELLRRILNTREVIIKKPSEVREVIRYKIEPRYASLGPKYRELTPEILKYLLLNEERIAKDIIANGVHKFSIKGREIVISSEDVNIIPTCIKGYVVHEAGWGSLALDTTLTEEEVAEGLAKDIIRRIQTMRKELNLSLNEYIEVKMVISADHADLIKKKLRYIANEVRASSIEAITRDALTGLKDWLMRRWVINGNEYIISIRKSSYINGGRGK